MKPTMERYKRIRRKGLVLLKSVHTRELIIFSGFVLISLIFWMLQTSQDMYEIGIRVPIKLTNQPKDIILSSDLPEEIAVTIKDKGVAFLRLKKRKIDTIKIDYSTLKVEKSILQIPTSGLLDAIRKTLPVTRQIINIEPSSIQLFIATPEAKEFDVVLRSAFTPAPNYIQSGEVSYSPMKVQVHAPSDMLDSIRVITTEFTQHKDLNDTLTTFLQLEQIEGAKFSTDKIKVVVPIEEFTEKSLLLNVTAKNIPPNYQLRCFPPKVTLTCLVGLSKFVGLTDSLFSVGVDYADFKNRANEQLAVQLLETPSYVHNVRIEPDSVEFILEEIYRYD